MPEQMPFPPFPELPKSIIERFPELKPWMEEQLTEWLKKFVKAVKKGG